MVRDSPLDWPDPAEAATAAEQALDRPIEDATTIDEGVNAAYRLELGDGTRAFLKAATLAPDEAFRPEPHLLALVGRETDVPVPEVLAAVPPAEDADENPLEVAFFVSRYCEGRHETDVLELSPEAHERFVRVVGHYLADLHDLDVAEQFGVLRVADGELTVPDPRDSWPEWFGELAEEVLAGLDGEGHLMDDAARFADLEPTVRDAFERFPRADPDRDVTPAALHGDPRPANVVFAPDDDADPLVRAVLDFGAETGDGLLDLARAEDALIDLPLGESERADELRRVLRKSYRDHRDAEVGDPFPTRYASYRLYARAKALAGFDFWAQFAREDDRDAIARRWRSFVRERLAEVE
jgi:aminoglycoside phosphotransferase (APT) family kinase protein